MPAALVAAAMSREVVVPDVVARPLVAAAMSREVVVPGPVAGPAVPAPATMLDVPRPAVPAAAAGGGGGGRRGRRRGPPGRSDPREARAGAGRGCVACAISWPMPPGL